LGFGSNQPPHRERQPDERYAFALRTDPDEACSRPSLDGFVASPRQMLAFAGPRHDVVGAAGPRASERGAPICVPPPHHPKEWVDRQALRSARPGLARASIDAATNIKPTSVADQQIEIAPIAKAVGEGGRGAGQ
jgi:hypothetical protein